MKTMILMDTREKIAHKATIIDAFHRHGVEYERTKLWCGDYTLPADQSVCIDVKHGLQEVYSNLVHEHERFRRECLRAIDGKIRLILLVEEPGIRTLADVKTWANPREEQYNLILQQIEIGTLPPSRRPKGPPLPSPRLYRIMRTFRELYGIEWEFCDPAQTGDRILELLKLI